MQSRRTQKLEVDVPEQVVARVISTIAPSLPTRRAAIDLNHRQRYATLEEIEWLRQCTENLPKDGLVVMLGAGPGVMAAAVKDGNPDIPMFIVDIDTVEYAMAHLRDYGPDYAKDVYYMIGDSAAIGTRYSGSMADLLIVDADHTEAAVSADLVTWLGHVQPGGYIFCHDYDASGTWFAEQERYPGVKVAVDRILRNYRQVGRVGTSMVFINEVVYG